MALEMQLEDNRKQLMQEQESLIANTAESKDLILDLKGELDAAREEISPDEDCRTWRISGNPASSFAITRGIGND